MATMGPGIHYVQGQPQINIRSPAQPPPHIIQQQQNPMGGMGMGGPGGMRPQMMSMQQQQQQAPNITIMAPSGGPMSQLPPNLAAAMNSPAGINEVLMGSGPGSAVNSPQAVSSTTGGPPSIGQLHPPHASPHPQQQQMHHQAMQRPHDQSMDSVTKAKALMGPLKQSLEILIRNASLHLQQNAMMDLGMLRGGDKSPERFEKAMEEFCALCDELQLHLKVALETSRAHYSSNKFVPAPVNPNKIDYTSQPPTPAPGDNSISYAQYLNTVRCQTSFVSDLRKMMMDFARGLTPQ